MVPVLSLLKTPMGWRVQKSYLGAGGERLTEFLGKPYVRFDDAERFMCRLARELGWEIDRG